MIRYLFVYTCLLLFAFCTYCKGQNKKDLSKGPTNSETKGVITTHGPSRIVRAIIQDRKGNIWMASWEGIIRYDGKSFTNITSKVSSARFFSVLEDRKGIFWFATVGSGVYYYDGKSFQHFTTKEGLRDNVVLSIYEDKKGNIWFGTGGGASRYDGKSFQNSKEILFLEDKTGKLWFGTGGGARFYDGKTFTVLTHKGKPFRNVGTIIEDKKGNILFSDADGLWRYDGSIVTNLTKRGGLYIIEDKKGNIWSSSRVGKNFVLLRYDGKSLANKKPTETIVKSEGENNAFFGILEAFDGSIWVGSGNGVYRYDGKTFTNFKSKEGQPTGTFTESRDGQTYKTISFKNALTGTTVTWMAQNLNYKVQGSYAYDDKESNRKKFGLLYTWEAAKKACPKGWHLATDSEWSVLVTKFGGMDKAGEALKSVSGWEEDGNGTNSSGFNALPAGIRKNNRYERMGLFGFWFTSTPAGKEGTAWGWDMSFAKPLKTKVFRFDGYVSSYAESVRCVRD